MNVSISDSVEKRTYGWTGRDMVFPIIHQPKMVMKARSLGITTAFEDYLARNVMTAMWWFDGKVAHLGYRCDRCKTMFLGTEISDFSHGCDNERLLDFATFRCGHEMDIGPCWSDAERQHKKDMASKFRCTGCEITRVKERINNAK